MRKYSISVKFLRLRLSKRRLQGVQFLIKNNKTSIHPQHSWGGQ